jgi:hypothetical protein
MKTSREMMLALNGPARLAALNRLLYAAAREAAQPFGPEFGARLPIAIASR